MRLRFGKRLLTGISGLLILALGAYALIFATGLFVPKLDLTALATSMALWQRIVLIVVALLLCALGIQDLGILFHRRDEKGFVMQHTDLGDMSISLNALNSMVCKCVEQHKELSVKSTKIYRAKEGIEIDIRILLESGVNIPLTVNALQKQIKQYITSCSGVDVKVVKVLVETGADKLPPAPVVRDAQPIREAPVKPEPAARAAEEPATTAEPVMESFAQHEEEAPAPENEPEPMNAEPVWDEAPEEGWGSPEIGEPANAPEDAADREPAQVDTDEAVPQEEPHPWQGDDEHKEEP